MKKTFRILGSIVVFAVLLFLSFRFFSNGNFMLTATNFDSESRLVAYTTPSLDFTFSQDLDPNFNEQDFVISPAVEGQVTVQKHQLSFVLSQELAKDTTYEITIKNLATKDKKSELKTLTFMITAIDIPTVTKILPEGDVQNLQQDITVFFSSPMVPLGTLDTMEQGCPLTFEPAIEGECKRISTSILQFRPTKLNGATNYILTVKKSPNMLFDIAEFTGSFTTPALDFEVTVGGGRLQIISNYPVEKADLQKHLNLFKESRGGSEADEELSFSLESQDSETFNISSPQLAYGSFYRLTLDAGLTSKTGNLPTANNERLQFFQLLKGIQSFVDTFSATGAYLSTQFINALDMDEVNTTISAEAGLKIAPNHTFLLLEFQDEQPLDKSYFQVVDEQGKQVSFSLEYGMDTLRSNELHKEIQKENKQKIKIVFKSAFSNFTGSNLIIKKGIDSFLKEDFKIPLVSLPLLQQTREPKLINNRKICIYTNHQLYETYTRNGDQNPSPARYFSTIPATTTLTSSSRDAASREDDTTDRCPEAKQGEEYLTVLHTKLNPNTEYELMMSKDLRDIYGQTLMTNNSPTTDKTAYMNADALRPFTSQPLSDKDQQIFGPKQINTYPGGVPIVASFGTTNLDRFLIEACAMTSEQYKDYLTRGYDPKRCKHFTTTTQSTKNLNRNLSTLQVDITQDLFKKAINEKYFLLNAKKNTNDKGTENLYLVKDFSLFLEQGDNKSLLFATDYDGTVVPGLTFTVYGITQNRQDWRQNKVTKLDIPITVNPSNGVYETTGLTNRNPQGYRNYLIVARDRQGRESSIVTNDDQISNRELSDTAYGDSTRHFMYLYTDRPLYKPGDTVYFKGIMREFGLEGFQKSPYKTGTLTILDPQWQNFKKIEITLDEYSNFSGSFTLPADIGLGAFSMRISLQDTYVKGDYTFRIEEYVKPTFKLSALAKKADLLPGEKAEIEVDATYYFGGTMQQAKGTREMLSQNYFFDPKGCREYQFGEDEGYFACIQWGDCRYRDTYHKSDSFTTDNVGKYTIQHRFPKDATSEKIYSFNIVIQDPDTQKAVQQHESVILHTTDGYVGLKGNYRIDKKTGISLEGIVLDWQAEPLANKHVELELFKIERKAAKELGPDGSYYTTYTKDEISEKKQTITTDQYGKFSALLAPKESGDYLIKARYKGGNGQAFVSSKQVYVDGSDYVFINQGNNSITTLIAEKPLLNIGESQTFTLKSPLNDATALFVVEKNNGILDYFVKEVTSFGQKFELPIKETYYPNIFLKAYLIGSQPNNSLPLYKIALGTTNVTTEHQQLNVALTTDKALYKPGEAVEVTVSVTDQAGNPVADANGSLSVVDQSLLALKGNPQKNPFSFFYEMKRGLEVVSYTSLKNLVEKLEVKDDEGSKGGDGTYDNKKKRGNFKDTAYRNANFTTDKNGIAKLTTDTLPDNLTTWVIEALMNTSDTKIGIQYTTIQTQQQVMINDNLPQFFGEGDKITLSPVIVNRLGKDADFEVKMTVTNGKVLTKPPTVHIATDSSATVYFDVEIDTIAETTESIVTIETNGDAIEKTIPIYPTRTLESTSTFGSVITGSSTEGVTIASSQSSQGDKSEIQGTLAITQGATLLVSLLDGLKFLEQFPYGCLEQQFSALMPQLYLKKLYQAVGKDYDLTPQAFQDLILSLHNYQNADGGMLYRDTSLHSDLSLSLQVLNHLTLLQSNNYKWDKTSIDNLIKYLKAEFYRGNPAYCSTCNYTTTQKLEILDAIQSYRHSLKQQDVEIEKMYAQLSFANLSVSAKLLQARVLSKLPDKWEETLKIFNQILNDDLTMNSKGAFLEAETLSKRVQYTANLLLTIAELGPEHFGKYNAVIDNLQRRLINQKEDGSFGSTQDTIKVIQALTQYLVATNELKNVNMTSELFINSKRAQQLTFTDENKLQSSTTIQPFASLPPTNQITFQKQGNGHLYYDMTMKYYLPSLGLPARDAGFLITKAYYDFTAYKAIERVKNAEWQEYQDGIRRYSQLTYPNDVFSYLSPITEFKVGQLVIVHLNFWNGKSRDKVALESYLPASAEIINPHLDTSITFNTDTQEHLLTFEREEYRADRFFAYISSLPPGKWTTSYLIRMSYAGTFNIKPTRIGEFYDMAVFGRTAGEQITIHSGINEGKL